MPSSQTRQGLVIVATLATAYVASHFFRASNVTIGLDLMRTCISAGGTGRADRGVLLRLLRHADPTGFFFDHFGPRRTVVGC